MKSSAQRLVLIAWPFLAALAAWAVARADEPVSYYQGTGLAVKYHCQACHQPYDQSAAPTWHAIAEKYADDPHAVGDLETKVLNGSDGVWGPQPMPPYQVPERDLRPLVEWILSLR